MKPRMFYIGSLINYETQISQKFDPLYPLECQIDHSTNSFLLIKLPHTTQVLNLNKFKYLKFNKTRDFPSEKTKEKHNLLCRPMSKIVIVYN